MSECAFLIYWINKIIYILQVNIILQRLCFNLLALLLIIIETCNKKNCPKTKKDTTKTLQDFKKFKKLRVVILSKS